MVDKKPVLLKSQNELGEWMESYFKNESNGEDGYLLDFDKELFKLHITITGDKYFSTITTPIMEHLLEIQKGIYALYRQYVGRRLTRDEKKRLELVVHVEKGSSDIVVWLLEQAEVIKEAVSKMTGDQTFASLIIGMAIFGLISIGKKAIDHFDKKHEREIEERKQNAQTEKEKYLVDALKESVAIIAGSREKALKYLAEIDEDSKIVYTDDTLYADEIKKRITANRKKEEPDISTITGSYRITKLHFNFEANSARADMYDVKTKEDINSLEIQPRSIIDGTYAVLKKAQDKEDIKLQIIVRKKDNKIVKATLDKIL
jgi:hypothetical protein